MLDWCICPSGVGASTAARPLSTCVYVYIYIYMYRERER